MNNTGLKFTTIFFAIGMGLLIVVTIYAITGKHTSTEDSNATVMKDEQLKVLNRVDGIEGPALYMDQRLRTSLYACNTTKKPIHISSDGIFRSETTPPVIVVIDPVTIERDPGCAVLIRMTPGDIASRGLTPGVWHIEGARTVRENDKEIQRLVHKSETFQVLAR